ncbi:MAG: carbohydrate-binding family 9-like protein [Opitutaceae bacterium]|jgi:hypothetical protein|nr:carbohydrate-binding family 9-like protein [Opitutaceae bacterium]
MPPGTLQKLPFSFFLFLAPAILFASLEIPALDVPRATTPPLVTADADDPAWKNIPTTPLALVAGRDDAKEKFPRPETGSRFALQWEPDALHVRFWCASPAPAQTPHGTQRDAPHHEGDVVEVFLDPVGDGRAFIELQVTPANGIRDVLYLVTAEPRHDTGGVLLSSVIQYDQWELSEWNLAAFRTAAAPWENASAPHGWIIDFAIPATKILRRLEHSRFREHLALRAHFIRYAPASFVDATAVSTAQTWSTAVPPGRPHRAPATMGKLRLVP